VNYQIDKVSYILCDVPSLMDTRDYNYLMYNLNLCKNCGSHGGEGDRVAVLCCDAMYTHT
jgi:hypothetical protein